MGVIDEKKQLLLSSPMPQIASREGTDNVEQEIETTVCITALAKRKEPPSPAAVPVVQRSFLTRQEHNRDEEDDDDDLTDIGALIDDDESLGTPSSTSHSGPSKRAKISPTSTYPGSNNVRTPADLVQLRGSRLVLKQKSKVYTNGMPTMTAIVKLNTHCAGLSEPLENVPIEHLPLIARFTQDSAKAAPELAKLIRRGVFPSEGGESQQSADSGNGSEKLPLRVIEAAIETVAERVNYGLGPSDLPSSSSTSAAAGDTIPGGLQLWRWEVRDLDLIQQERQQDVVALREERRQARHQAVQLFNALSTQERQQLLSGSGKKRGLRAVNKPKDQAKTVNDASLVARSPSAKMQAVQRAVSPSALEDTDTIGVSPSRPASEAESKADSGVIMIDDEDEQQGGASPATKRQSLDVSKTKTKKATTKKDDALTSEQRVEKERKEREKEEKKKVKKEKDAKRQKAAELQKKSANMMFDFFGKTSPTKEVTITGSATQAPLQSDFQRVFAPIVYKDLAPINRFNRKIDTEELDRQLSGFPKTPKIEEMLLEVAPRRSSSSVVRLCRERSLDVSNSRLSVRETMRLVAESDLMTGADAEKKTRIALESLQDRKKIPIKLLQFATDLRPGWFGTWTRPSNIISGRRPLRQDPVALDYNYDSDAEWVDGEDDVKGDEVEEDDDAEEALSVSSGGSEMDDWLVDDLEEVEGGEDDLNGDVDDPMPDVIEMDPLGNPLPLDLSQRSSLHDSAGPLTAAKQSTARRKIPLPGKAGLNTAGGRKKGKKVIKNARCFTQKLVPVVLGPFWEQQVGEPAHPTFADYQMEFINDAFPGLNPFTFNGDESTPDTSDVPVHGPSAATSSISVATKASGPLYLLLTSPSKASASGSKSVHAALIDSVAPATGRYDVSDDPPPIPEAVLHAVLRTIDGSTDNKPVLVDVLFKDFKEVKGVNKKRLTQTVDLVASREGRRVDSPWRIKAEWRAKVGLI